MHLERITSENHPMYKKAMELYHKSFPWHEQRENSSQDEISIRRKGFYQLTQDEYDTFRRGLETMVMKNVYNNIGKK